MFSISANTLLKTLVVSFIGGCSFYFFHVPLPWMLGPIVFINIMVSIWKAPVFWPVNIRNAGLIVLGYIMGRSFTADTIQQITVQLPAMLVATISTVLFSLFIGYVTHKKTGISLASSVLGSTPGGMTQMVVLSEEVAGSDTTVVTFLQTIRLLSVVFIVPFIAVHALPGGSVEETAFSVLTPVPYAEAIFAFVAIISGLTANALKLPTPFLLGPMLGTSALVLNGFAPPTVPWPLLVAAQLSVGIYMGVNTRPTNLENWRVLLPYSVIGGILIVLFTLVIGYLLTLCYQINIITAFLSTAPGGMTEMGITALNVGANISIIMAYQLFRLLFMLLILPFVLKWWLAPRYNLPGG